MAGDNTAKSHIAGTKVPARIKRVKMQCYMMPENIIGVGAAPLPPVESEQFFVAMLTLAIHHPGFCFFWLLALNNVIILIREQKDPWFLIGKLMIPPT